jgi:hypothetical protein
MKELVVLLVCVAVLAGGALLATETLDDRELTVPPPDAVSEGFVRAVSLERFDPARAYVSDDVAMNLRALHAQIGRAEQVEAETVEQSDEQALVRVQTESAKANHLLYVSVEWEQEWKVSDVRVSY